MTYYHKRNFFQVRLGKVLWWWSCLSWTLKAASNFDALERGWGEEDITVKGPLWAKAEVEKHREYSGKFKDF